MYKGTSNAEVVEEKQEEIKDWLTRQVGPQLLRS